MAKSYRDRVEATNTAARDKSRRERDIASRYPGPGDLKRRSDCERDLKLFCETYFPAAFSLAWSPDHLRVLAKLQTAILDGGLFALAMPRGSGKTTLVERAALWALLYGHRRFVALVGATEKAAGMMLQHVRDELAFNDLLADDFRAVCYPIRRLENNGRRATGQLFDGRQTCITWGKAELTFPTMPDEACDGVNVSGSTVTVSGLTGALRGQSHLLPDGRVIRPELVILDDPQTRESANSSSQCAERLAIVRGDVLGMAGPGQKIAAVMPCTVIRDNDLADQLLNRALCPEKQGERTKAVLSWPKNDALWEQYRKIRADALRHERGAAEANAFYTEHRAAMDEGATVAWPERRGPGDVSAIQHLMNARFDLKDAAFFAEFQNEPQRADLDEVSIMPAAEIMGRVNNVPRGVAPVGAEQVTAFIDVHDSLLFWAVIAWKSGLSGWIMDYGAYPEQRRRNFTLRKASPTLASVAPGAGRDGAILAGLTALVGKLASTEWRREDGGTLRLGKLLIDAGYVPDVVFDLCRRSTHAGILLPSRGAGVGAKGRAMGEWIRRPGERHGPGWLVGRVGTRTGLSVRHDANHWKSFVHTRLAVALGDPGSLSLYGRDGEHHRLLAEHLTSEVPIRVTANGRTVDEWRSRPGVADNHYLDCVVGCAVGASILGVSIEREATAPRKRVSMAMAQAAARARRMGRSVG